MKLEKNYRSTTKILDIANTIISKVDCGWSDKALELYTDIKEQGDVQYKSHDDGVSESVWIAEKIRWLSRHNAYSDMAILAILIRMTFLSGALESVFMLHHIPYTIVSGISFYDRAEIKDLLSYLRFISNPKDAAVSGHLLI